MNKLVLIMLLFATSLIASAQDVIVEKNGSTILSKVVEVGTTEIKYKKWNNLNGPNYSILKSKIQSINYENGLKDVFNEEEITQPQNVVNNYQGEIAKGLTESNRLKKEKLLASAKTWEKASGWAFGVPFVGGMVLGLILEGEIKDDFFDNTTYLLCAGAGTIVGVTGMIMCYSVSNKKYQLAKTITASHVVKRDFEICNSRLTTSIDLLNDNFTNNRTLGFGVTLNL